MANDDSKPKKLYQLRETWPDGTFAELQQEAKEAGVTDDDDSSSYIRLEELTDGKWALNGETKFNNADEAWEYIRDCVKHQRSFAVKRLL
jgi:hypothetical protein